MRCNRQGGRPTSMLLTQSNLQLRWSDLPTWRPVRLYSICRWLWYGVVNKTNLEPLLTPTVLVSLNKISRVVKCIRHRPLCSLEYSLTPVDFGRRNTNSRLHYIILHFKSANCPKSVALTSSENTMKRVLSLYETIKEVGIRQAMRSSLWTNATDQKNMQVADA